MFKYIIISLVLVTSFDVMAKECTTDDINNCTQICTQAQNGQKVVSEQYTQCFNSCMSQCTKPKKKAD